MISMKYLRSWPFFLVGTVMILQIVLTVAEDSDPPTPDIALTNMFPKTDFHRALYAMWEPDHADVSADESSVTLTLDHISGNFCVPHISPTLSGFLLWDQILREILSWLLQCFDKAPGNYSAGVVTTFYMSNTEEFPQNHDEFDFEFLGTIPGEPYTIQTNIYGDGKTELGREQRFRLWFDPTEEFHDYSFLWNANHTVFFVDNIPIWEFPKMKEMGKSYPSKQMSLYGTIWDASRWATDGGRYSVDYTYQPFVATYSNFIVNGCYEFNPSDSPDSCPPIFNESIPPGLTKKQLHALHWVQSHLRFYTYCTDFDRYPDTSLVPECVEERSRALSDTKPAHPEETFLHIQIQTPP